MRICRDGHAACAEALRETKGVASVAVPAAMKWRRSRFGGMILSRGVADGTASGRLCHGWQGRQIGAFEGPRCAYSGVIRTIALSHDTQPDDFGQGYRKQAKGAADQHVDDALLRDAAGAAGERGGQRDEEAAQAEADDVAGERDQREG